MSNYEDMIDLPHPTSRNHPRMSLHDRAAQFAPFAALTGHDAAIRETARITDEEQELSEEARANVNEKLYILQETGTGQNVTITYFIPDERKTGGAYVTHTGRVKKILPYEKELILEDETAVPMERIRAISGELFEYLEKNE